MPDKMPKTLINFYFVFFVPADCGAFFFRDLRIAFFYIRHDGLHLGIEAGFFTREPMSA